MRYADERFAPPQEGTRMSALAPSEQPRRQPMRRAGGRRSTPAEWRGPDRIALVFAWGAGLLLCVIAGAIVIYMGYRGIQYLKPSLLWTHPEVGTSQTESGGFLDPIEGTALLTGIAIILSFPLAVCTALWIAARRQPHHRRHGVRRRAARLDLADRTGDRHAGGRLAQRTGLDSDELRVRKLAGRRRRRAAEGLRRRLRPVGARIRPQPAGRAARPLQRRRDRPDGCRRGRLATSGFTRRPSAANLLSSVSR